MFDLNKEAGRIHKLNEKWWVNIKTGAPIERNEGELFCLMASELSEALEGERKSLMDTHLTHLPMAGVEMADFDIRILDYCGRREIKLEDYYTNGLAASRFPWINVTSKTNRASLIWKMHEHLVIAYGSSSFAKSFQFSFLLASARLYCDTFGYDFERSYNEKIEYNIIRADHKLESRKLANGKKF